MTKLIETRFIIITNVRKKFMKKQSCSIDGCTSKAFVSKVKQAVIEECKKYDVKNYTNIFVIMGIN